MSSENQISEDGTELCADRSVVLLHSLDGPAMKVIPSSLPERFRGGDYFCAVWAINGEEMTFDQWVRHPLVIEQRLNQALKELACEE